MSRLATLSLVLLRITIGWYFLYLGIAAFTTDAWSIKPMIENAATFSEFYTEMAGPSFVVALSYVAKILYVLIGISLITGLFARGMALIGFILTLFFYFPLLQFPLVEGKFYLVNNQFIIVVVLLYLFAARAGDHMSIGKLFGSHSYHE